MVSFISTFSCMSVLQPLRFVCVRKDHLCFRSHLARTDILPIRYDERLHGEAIDITNKDPYTIWPHTKISSPKVSLYFKISLKRTTTLWLGHVAMKLLPPHRDTTSKHSYLVQHRLCSYMSQPDWDFCGETKPCLALQSRD